jgi:transposase
LTAVLRHVRKGANGPQWLMALLARRPAKIVAVALANKMARIVFALLTKGGQYRRPEWASGMEPTIAA